MQDSYLILRHEWMMVSWAGNFAAPKGLKIEYQLPFNIAKLAAFAK